MIDRIPAGWVAVARDTLEYNMRAWVGRRHEQWLRSSLRPHAVDPRGQVLVPSEIHAIFQKRRHFTPATGSELTAAGYPRLPRNRTGVRDPHTQIAPDVGVLKPAQFAAMPG